MSEFRKRKPSGFIAVCQCGEVVGALDYERTDRKDCGRLLGAWLAEGCTIKPMFKGSCSVSITTCICNEVKP